MLKLKLQYFGQLMWRADSFEKALTLGKIEGGRRRGWQRIRWLDGITDSMDMSLGTPGVGDGQGGLVCCSLWSRRESDTTERLNWTFLQDHPQSLDGSIFFQIKSNPQAASFQVHFYLNSTYTLQLITWMIFSLPSRISPLETPWTTAHQAPLSMGFTGQEHWNG